MTYQHRKISLANIPLINLRVEYRKIYDFWLSSELATALIGDEPASLNTGSMHIVAHRSDLLTFTLQRCFLGLEVYVQSAARHAYILRYPSGFYDWDTFPRAHQIQGEKRLAAQLYKCLPKIVDEDLSLASLNKDLYQWLLGFYRYVRNPIFHGKQVQKVEIDTLHSIAINIAITYKWIDSWYEPHQAFRPIRLNPDIFFFPKLSLAE